MPLSHAYLSFINERFFLRDNILEHVGIWQVLCADSIQRDQK